MKKRNGHAQRRAVTRSSALTVIFEIGLGRRSRRCTSRQRSEAWQYSRPGLRETAVSGNPHTRACLLQAAQQPLPRAGSTVLELAGRFLSEYPSATRTAYASSLAGFLTWTDRQGLDPVQVSRHDLQRWSMTMLEAGLAGSSACRHLAAVSGLLRLAVEDGHRQDDPTLRLRRPARDRTVDRRGLDLEQVRLLLQAAGQQDPHTACLVSLLALLALRLGEALAVQVEDVADRHDQQVLRVRGKGGTVALLPLPDPTVEAVRAARAGRRTGPLLITRTGRPLHPRTARRQLARLGERCGLPGVFPHALRSAWVDIALTHGVPLEQVSQGCRHADIRQTAAYRRLLPPLTQHPVFAVAAAVASVAYPPDDHVVVEVQQPGHERGHLGVQVAPSLVALERRRLGLLHPLVLDLALEADL